jgi:hypothetical protein
MWRLHPRGAANQGVCVDADGAMLGPDCVLVQRTPFGHRSAHREAARDVQRILLSDKDDPDWLYDQGQRIAKALDRGEIALAQIYGLRIPVRDLDGRQLKQLAALAPLAKADFNPDEPRIPAGQPEGGEWTTGEDAGAAGADASPMATLTYSEEPPPAPPPPFVGGRWPAPANTNGNPLFQPAQAEEDENARGGAFFEFMNLPREFRLEQYDALRARLREIEPGNSALQTLTGPNYSPTQADIDELYAALVEAQARAGEPPSPTWTLGWSARGIEFELQRLRGQRTLPSNTPTIDDFSYDVALSIKSIDLNASWYRDPVNLSRQIDRYVDRLVSFDGLRWGGFQIGKEDIKGRVLDIVVPKNSGTAAQREAITRSEERAGRLGIHILISPY